MPTAHKIFSKMSKAFPTDTLLFITINLVNGKHFNDTLVEIEMESDLITIPMTMDSREYPTNLRAPVSYKLEDLLMSLAILLILLWVFILWYFLTRLIIHLAYHETMARIKTIYEEGEGCSINFNNVI